MTLIVTQEDNDLAALPRKSKLTCATCPVAQAFLRIGYEVHVSPMVATVCKTGQFIELPDDLSLAIVKYDTKSVPILGTFEVTPSISYVSDMHNV